MTAIATRKAKDDDVAAIADIHVRSWQAAYRGVLPDELLDGLPAEERAQSWCELLSNGGDHWLTLVATRQGDKLAGFCSVATPSRDPDAGEATAEVGALYVDPDHWREGAGSALMKATLEELARLGWREVVLWVLPENQPALAFYDRFGFAVEEGVEKREERSGRTVVRLRASATGKHASNGWTIRRGTQADIDPVLALWRRAEGPTTETDDEGALADLLARDREALLVATSGDEVIGSLIAGWDGWRGSFYRLAVDPDWRRRGMATALIHAGEEQLRALGARRLTAIVLSDDEAAIEFWTAAGYERQTARTRFVRMLEQA
jgi:ribosomal protein S18 acetylase RimI-like enzyme